MKRPRILVVGSLVMDLIAETPRFPSDGETLLGTGFSTASGGKGANQAVQAARLGADVTLVGKVGMDSFGGEMIENVRAAGVHTHHVLRTDRASSGVGHIQIEKAADHAQNRIVVIPGANMQISPADVAFLKDEIKQYDLVMLQLEIPLPMNRLVIEWAKKAGIKIMLNPAPYAPLRDDDLNGVTFISPNETEAEAMTGAPLHTPEEAKTALFKLKAMGVHIPIITMGSLGAVCLWKGQMIFEKALAGLPVKDPTAAGDSFVGAFCTAAAAGCGVCTALAFAKHAAGITVCGMGAQPSLPAAKAVFDNLEASGGMNHELLELKGVLLG